MLTFLKKWWFVCLIVIVVLYLAIGAVAPFIKYKQISQETAADKSIAEQVAGAQGSADRVMLLENNGDALDERIRLLEMAQKRIIISTFDMREGKSADDIGAVLLQKADEGVAVSLLIDGFNGSFRLPGSDFFETLASHPNIEIRLYNPIHLLTPWTSQGRMHDKYVLVDDIGYIMGGRNTFDYFLGEYPTEHRSHDRDVLIYNGANGRGANDNLNAGSSLKQVENYFYEVWDGGYCKAFGKYEQSGKIAEASVKLPEKLQKERERLNARYAEMQTEKPELFAPYEDGLNRYENSTYETDGVFLIRGETGIYGKEPKVLHQLECLMEQAQEKVVIHTPYAVCNKYMYGVLDRVAQAVPRAELMLNSVENGDNFFGSADYLYNKGKLVDTGVQLYEYDGGDSYHGKSIVIDDEIAIVGSYNFDLRSTYVDTELMLVIKSKELASELAGQMEQFQRECRKVLTEKEYEVPENVTVAHMPVYKKVLMYVVGGLAQTFRCLI